METFFGGVFTVFVLYIIIYFFKKVSASFDTTGKAINSQENQCLVDELNNLRNYSELNVVGQLDKSPVLFNLETHLTVIELLQRNVVETEFLFKALYLSIGTINSPLSTGVIDLFNKKILREENQFKINYSTVHDLIRYLKDSELIRQNLYEKVENLQRNSNLKSPNSSLCIVAKVETLFLFRALIGWPYEKGLNIYIEERIKICFGKRRRKFTVLKNHVDEIMADISIVEKVDIENLLNSLLKETYSGELFYYSYLRDKMTIRLIYEYGISVSVAKDFLEKEIYIKNGIYNTPFLINLIYRYKRLQASISLDDFSQEYELFVNDVNRVLNRS